MAISKDSRNKKRPYSAKRGIKFNGLNTPSPSRYKLMRSFASNLRKIKTIYACRRGLRYCKPVFMELLNSKKLISNSKRHLLVKKQQFSTIKLKSRKLSGRTKTSIVRFTRKLKGSLLNNVHRITLSNAIAPEKKFNMQRLQ